MKKIISSLVFSFVAFAVVAQAPQKMTYQAVIREANNMLLENTAVGVQISIIETSTFLPVYVETHTGQTNDNGLVTLQIGDGVVQEGDFATIDWGNGEYSIQIDTDPNGGTDYSISGMSELLSVPYALYAGNSGGNTLQGAYNEGGPGEGRVITTDDGPVEINNLSSNAGLKVNNLGSNAFAVDAAQSGTGIALRGISTNPSNSFPAIRAQSNSTVVDNAALAAENTGVGFAISGTVPASATGPTAIYGLNLRPGGGSGMTGIGFNGVIGRSENGLGFGVYGINNNPGSETVPSIGTYGLGFNGVYGQTSNVTDGWAGYFTADVGVEGTGYAVGGWVNASDSRLKSNVQSIDNALDKLTLLSGKHYTLTTKTKDAEGRVQEQQREQYGVMAQELETVFPEMIAEKALFINSGDATEYKTVEYTQLIPVLLEAIKELKAEVDELKGEVEQLRSKK
jgi:hypothetical protein